MSEIKLIKDSDALICALYKVYLEKREDDVSKRDAKSFGGAKHIQETIVPKWSLGDVEETLWELERAGFLMCKPADNTIVFTRLADPAIIFMENRFKNGLSEVLDYVQKVKSILLW